MCRSLLVRSCFPLIALVCFSGARAQTDATRVYGAEDADIPTPAIHVPLGQQDAGALQELIDYLKAVDPGKWQGLKATGSFADQVTDAASPDQADLEMLPGNRFRLDIHTANGIRSTRIAGTYGRTMGPGGKSTTLPEATAKIGLVFFPHLLAATFPAPGTTLIDRGEVQIGSRLLHRVTVGEPLLDDQSPKRPGTRILIADLYFETTSHLLIKSVAAIQLSSTDRSRYIQVVTYDDYHKIQNGLLPLSLHQSLNGQPQWTLELSDVNLAPVANDADFYF